MSIRIETVPAKYAAVHRVDRGEELVEDSGIMVESEVALTLSYDEVVAVEGTEKRVNLLAARMLASVPGGTYMPVGRARLEHWAEHLDAIPGEDARSLAVEIRAVLQR